MAAAIKLDSVPRWALQALATVCILGLGFLAHELWDAAQRFNIHEPLSTQSFESIARTLNDQTNIQTRNLEQIHALETRVSIVEERSRKLAQEMGVVDVVPQGYIGGATETPPPRREGG